jgi:hypothetical protein
MSCPVKGWSFRTQGEEQRGHQVKTDPQDMILLILIRANKQAIKSRVQTSAESAKVNI